MEHVWHVYVVRCENRDELQQYLTDSGIQTIIHYPIAPHKQLAYKEMNSKTFSIAEKIHAQVLSLPISPVMTNAEITKVIMTVNNFE